MTLLYVSAAWVSGIYLGSKLHIPPVLLLLGAAPFLLLPFLQNHRKYLFLAALCLLALIGGSLRFQDSLPQKNEGHLQFYNDKGTVQITGMVSTEPERAGNYMTFQFTATEVQFASENKATKGKVIVYCQRYSKYRYGDILKITGELQTPPEIGHFNYGSYLAQQGVYSLIFYPQIELVARDKGFKPLSWIYSVRTFLSRNLIQALPEPQASVAQAILLGLRTGLPTSLQDAFSQAGTAHLLAISGLHLSIIIGMVTSAVIRLFGKRYYIYVWLALFTIWAYAIMTAMRPPIVRGAFMGTLFLLAEYLGRPGSAITALAFAATIMSALNPQILWNASFQLSFLAMAGLIVLAPYFQAVGREKLSAATVKNGSVASLSNFVIDSLAVTSAAIVATCPVIAYHFGTISFVSLPATLFSLLALPGMIITASLVSIVGLTIPVLSQLLGWIAWVFLSYFIFITQAYNAIPFSHIELPQLHPWQVLAYYLLLAGTLAAAKNRKRIVDFISRLSSKIKTAGSRLDGSSMKRLVKWGTTCLLLGNTIVWAMLGTMADDKLHVSILDVGQGDAILIQTPNRQNILIDGGPDPRAIKLQLDKKIPYWQRTIDLVLLTQPQSDHLTGLIEIVQKHKIPLILDSGIPSNTTLYQEWLKTIHSRGIELKAVHAGQEINLGDNITLEVLHPPKSGLLETANKINDNGLVLRLSWNRVSFLFTADISKEAEWYLISQRENLRSSVLKVAHHGSKTATSTEFLSVVDPDVAVISVAANNTFGHPHGEVLDRLTNRLGHERVFLTSQHGTIEFITDGHRLWVKRSK